MTKAEQDIQAISSKASTVKPHATDSELQEPFIVNNLCL